RLFDLGTIIRRGVQYALARRVVESLIPVLVLVVGADVLLHAQEPVSAIAAARGWVYVAAGALVLGANARRRQWLDALDRRFFREQYNAQETLRRIAERIRAVGDFERAAPDVIAHIDSALHPAFA